jgi:outer membrane receptor protein involved in Fe transport
MRIRGIVSLALAGSSLVAFANTAQAQETTAPATAPADDTASEEESIVVLGSRIPRVMTEGPAPVTTITDDDILRNGYQDVPQLLRAITQNGGETQSQQSYSGADFTPGAQQVDLRGLGPNHTLVLVNGRRIADFPLPFGGNSNFTDISNIPVGMIERVEVLSGSASAVYGSDAISGVVNFKLKQKPDGTRIDLRGGLTEHGGGESLRLTVTSGFESGPFRALFGVEGLWQEPLWMYERSFQDSSSDNPDPDSRYARRNYLRADEYYYYINPGQATCDALAGENFGTTIYDFRPGRDTIDGDGYFCGSREAMGWGTMINERKALSGYGTLAYEIGDDTELFLDVQASYSKLNLFKDVLDWFYVAPDGNEEGLFYNPNYLTPDDTYSGLQLDYWERLFSPEEMGGFENGMTRNRSITYNITPGIRGQFGGGKWGYEVALNHAEYSSRVAYPEVIIDKANALFLGSEIDDPDNDTGYPRFDADPARLYTPLTPAEYASITAYSVYRPKTWVNNASASVNTTELFELPAGPVGFAAVAEIGNQGYEINPDPLALSQYYVGIIDSDGHGKRSHWGLGGELRVPVLSIFEVEGAARYDHYKYDGNGVDKFTYNIGAELRPIDAILIRGAYGTGFRAPDLHYVFKGPGNKHSGGLDYYLCRSDNSDAGYSDCDDYDYSFISKHNGNRDLDPETSTSFNAGIFLQPSRTISFSADYFRVKMKNQVLNMSIDTLLRDEAACLIGDTPSGEAIDPTSPTCVDAIGRIDRYVGGAHDGEIQSVAINPINIAQETTDGIDFAAHIRVPTESVGEFSLDVGYTYVLNHTIRQYPGDALEDKLEATSGYYIPREKGTASLSWTLDDFTTTLNAQRLGKLPNYDEDAFLRASYLFNLSAQYKLTDSLQVSGTINNLFDQKPVYDPTYTGYPYYDSSWFDGVGRSFYLQLTYKMGGSKL